MKCSNCKKEMDLGRSDKKFCSNKCRNNYNNKADYVSRLYKLTKKRAIDNNIPFNILLEDIVLPDFCPIFNIPLFRGEGRSNNSYSLDRILPELGYIKGNVWIISDRANRLKSNMCKEDLIMFCNTILSKII